MNWNDTTIINRHKQWFKKRETKTSDTFAVDHMRL